MAVIKCKMCGADLVLIPDSSIAECEYCGTQQTVPSADNEKKMTLFNRANRLRIACEFDKAAGIYEVIVADFPDEAEAYWGLVLCKYGIEYVDDPTTAKKIPTCHRSSFDSVMDDSNFEQALENADVVARKLYRAEAKQIEEVRKGIIEVSSKEDPYDIFICYKETDENGDRTLDSVLAQDLYDALTEKGYRVFFSRITLEDKLGQEYEPYIFAALNSAKVMLAIGTDYEHYNAVWVKNEWSRFLHLISAGQKKTLIPCYKNTDAYDMPKEFAKLQAQDLGKVGAIQDLLRGIGKLLQKPMIPAASAQVSNAEAVRIVENEKIQKQVENSISLGIMALDTGDMEKATNYFEEALKHDAECIGAYIGLLRVNVDSEKAAPYIIKIKSWDSEKILAYLKVHPAMIGNTNNRNNMLSIAANPLCSQKLVLGLLESGVHGNARNALMYSVESFDNSEITKAFIRSGANVNATHNWNYSYKQSDGYNNNEREQHSVLSMAIRNNRSMETIKALLEASADAKYVIQVFNGSYVDNKELLYTYSVLYLAMVKERYDVVELLLAGGADPSVKRTWRKKCSLRSGPIPRVEANNISILADAIWTVRSPQMLDRMLACGTDPNSTDTRLLYRKDSNGRSTKIGRGHYNALVDAIFFSEDTKMVELLLANGANPRSEYCFEALDENNYVVYKTEIPVLGIAIEKRRKDVVKLLVDAGASFDQYVTYYNRNLVRKEDSFPLRELAFSDEVKNEMRSSIVPLGWKGSKAGLFSKEHTCAYSW